MGYPQSQRAGNLAALMVKLSGLLIGVLFCEVGVPRGGGCLIWDVLVSIRRVADSMSDYYILSENWLLVVNRASYALRFFGRMKKLHSQPEGISLLANGSIAP